MVFGRRSYASAPPPTQMARPADAARPRDVLDALKASVGRSTQVDPDGPGLLRPPPTSLVDLSRLNVFNPDTSGVTRQDAQEILRRTLSGQSLPARAVATSPYNVGNLYGTFDQYANPFQNQFQPAPPPTYGQSSDPVYDQYIQEMRGPQISAPQVAAPWDNMPRIEVNPGFDAWYQQKQEALNQTPEGKRYKEARDPYEAFLKANPNPFSYSEFAGGDPALRQQYLNLFNPQKEATEAYVKKAQEYDAANPYQRTNQTYSDPYVDPYAMDDFDVNRPQGFPAPQGFRGPQFPPGMRQPTMYGGIGQFLPSQSMYQPSYMQQVLAQQNAQMYNPFFSQGMPGFYQNAPFEQPVRTMGGYGNMSPQQLFGDYFGNQQQFGPSADMTYDPYNTRQFSFDPYAQQQSYNPFAQQQQSYNPFAQQFRQQQPAQNPFASMRQGFDGFAQRQQPAQNPFASMRQGLGSFGGGFPPQMMGGYGPAEYQDPYRNTSNFFGGMANPYTGEVAPGPMGYASTGQQVPASLFTGRRFDQLMASKADRPAWMSALSGRQDPQMGATIMPRSPGDSRAVEDLLPGSYDQFSLAHSGAFGQRGGGGGGGGIF